MLQSHRRLSALYVGFTLNALCETCSRWAISLFLTLRDAYDELAKVDASGIEKLGSPPARQTH